MDEDVLKELFNTSGNFRGFNEFSQSDQINNDPKICRVLIPQGTNYTNIKTVLAKLTPMHANIFGEPTVRQCFYKVIYYLYYKNTQTVEDKPIPIYLVPSNYREVVNYEWVRLDFDDYDEVSIVGIIFETNRISFTYREILA